MSNFEVFQCNVCSRKTEKLVDQTHATLSKCTITYKCTGNLVRISQSDTKTMSGNTPASALTNWVPRGSVTSGTPQTQASSILLNDAQDVLAVAIDSSLVIGAQLVDFKFEVKQLVNSSFIEYFYNRPSNTTLITGQDDSSKRLTLRFAATDQIIVYVNGVEVDASTYNRNVLGRLQFNSVLTAETNQVRVLVYQQTAPKYVHLTFTRNDSASILVNPNSAWRNVSGVEIPKGTPYSVFTCTNLAGLAINSRLVLVDVNGFTGEFGYWLLADAPYSSYDRNTLNSVLISDMISYQEVIEFKNDSKNSPKFFMDSSSVKSLFPPIVIAQKISADVDLKIVNEANTRLVNAYIT